jgi:DNA invertase Pin-like site-specific DNA recombinase
MLVVWKFDCFIRSVSHLLRALDTFRALGIDFVSLSESSDTATPAGRMVFTMLAAVAELERCLIAERVRAGIRNAKAKGKRPGRSAYGGGSRTPTAAARLNVPNVGNHVFSRGLRAASHG